MIAGLVPCSFVDYPGRLAAVLFLQGCNLKCPYCHNPQLIGAATAPRLLRNDVLSWLASRFGRLTGVVFTGGEPTLHPRLTELIVAVREVGYRIKLDTNGTRPAILRQLLDQSLLDYVAMDLKDLPENYDGWLSGSEVEGAVFDSIALLKRYELEHEFRTTVLEPRHGIEILDGLRRLIGDDARWYLQRANDQVPFRQPGLHCLGQSQIDALVAELRNRGAKSVFARVV